MPSSQSLPETPLFSTCIQAVTGRGSLIIDRYILREILYTLLAVLAVLLVIFLSNRFVRYLADASVGDLSGEVVFTLLSMKALSALVIILPLGLFMAILLAFSRLYKDNEMVALAACGVSMRTVYRSVIALALIVAALVGAVSLVIAPWAEEQSYRILDAQKARTALAGVSPGRFTESATANGVLYVGGLSEDGRGMEDVFIQGRRPQGQIVVAARRGYQRRSENGEQFLVLLDGYRYEGVPGGAEFRVIRFREHAVRIEKAQVSPSFRKQRAFPTRDLIGSQDRADIAELQWRVSMPLSVVLLALLAVPLSRASPRQGKYARLFIAVLIYLIYNNLLGVANSWVARGLLSPLVGMWWVHAGILVSAWVLFARQYGVNWTLRAMFGRRAPR